MSVVDVWEIEEFVQVVGALGEFGFFVLDLFFEENFADLCVANGSIRILLGRAVITRRQRKH